MFITETRAKKLLIPGYNYFSVLQNFINKHSEVEEKYLDFLRSPCVDTCEQCQKPTFIGLKWHMIPKPKPDYSDDGYHYLAVSKTQSKMNDQKRKINDFSHMSTWKKKQKQNYTLKILF